MKSWALCSRCANSLALSCSCFSSMRVYSSWARMSCYLSYSRILFYFSFSLSFSKSIFYKYSFSCLLFSAIMCLSCSISFLSRMTISVSCAACSFISTFLRIFSSFNYLSREAFSASIFFLISLAFSNSLCSKSFKCCSCKFSYMRSSLTSCSWRYFFSLSWLSSSSLINLFRSLSLSMAYFYSS